MTDKTVVENKISAVKKYLKILEDYRNYSLMEIENNITVRGAVERYLYLAVQSTINLAEAIIAYQNLRKPTTLSEAFQILEENKIINADLADQLIKMVGFRNIMVHDYEKMDYNILYDVLCNRLADIEQFSDKMKECF